MRIARFLAASTMVLLLGCGDDGGATSDDGKGGDDGGSTSSSSGAGAGGAGCDGAGKPEMTGPIQGLEPSYAAGDPIDVTVPVDEDTRRVIVGVYEVGSELYLGGTAEDTMGPTTQALSFYAGVAGGEVGEFYLAIELCSTSLCTPTFVRNTYQRADRFAPMLATGETYDQTKELVGGDGTPQVCPSPIPIQSFLIQ